MTRGHPGWALDVRLFHSLLHAGLSRRTEFPVKLRGRRPDPFAGVWNEVRELLEVNASLGAKTVFKHLQRQYPGRFQDSQVRTLQRKVKHCVQRRVPAGSVFCSEAPARAAVSLRLNAHGRAWRDDPEAAV